MAGLQKICRMYGGLIASDGKKRVNYSWDYANERAVKEADMPQGSPAHAASEKAKWEALRKQWERNS
jgi:hypothetical protein